MNWYGWVNTDLASVYTRRKQSPRLVYDSSFYALKPTGMNTTTMNDLGRILYALAVIALGLVTMITGDFPAALLPFPDGFPGRAMLVYFIGTVLSVAGIGLLIPKKAYLAALLLGTLLLLFALFPHLPKLLENVYNGATWTPLMELVAMSGGAFLLAGSWPIAFPASLGQRLPSRLSTLGRWLFAGSLLVFAIQHFMYASFIATLIPAWIPGNSFWPYFVGFAFLASAVSLFIQRQVVLSTTLLGSMFFLWVVMLHIPRVVEKPQVEAEWTSTLIALAMAGISWMIGGLALREKSSTPVPRKAKITL